MAAIRGHEQYERLVSSWLASHDSGNTRAAYGADLALFGQWCASRDAIPLRVSAEDVVAYHTARALAGESDSTLRRRASSLSSFFQFAVAVDALAANPAAGVLRPALAPGGDPSPTHALSSATVEDHLRRAEEIDPRLHALVALLALDGLKLGEALALDVADVTGRAPRTSVRVRRGGGHQKLTLHREAAAAVRRCIRRRADGPVFVGARSSKRLTRFGADHLIKQLPSDRGVPLTANALRRFYVASSHAAGVDLDAIRDRAGLRDVRTARRYLTTNTNTDNHKEE